jgi:hypothetical protein
MGKVQWSDSVKVRIGWESYEAVRFGCDLGFSSKRADVLYRCDKVACIGATRWLLDVV